MTAKPLLPRAALLAGIVLATPVRAQTAPPPPADPAPAPAPADAQAGEQAPGQAAPADVVVTGLRRSLQSAQAIKRNSAQIVDSIVAQDIGKLPDVAISDTAARIVGVQVDRRGGEAFRVLVRGLPDFTTTYNGREIFTAEARGVALQDFPSGGIAALDVFKTTTADLIEGGIAGEINVRSRRPFDFEGARVAGAVNGLYTTQAGRWKPNGNLLVSDRWNTGIGEIGALLNFSYTRLEFLDSQRSNTDFIVQAPFGPGGQQIRFPDIARIEYFAGDRERPSLNGSLQWKPNDRLEVYADGLWQGFRNRITDRLLFVPLFGAAGFSNVVLRAGTDTPQSATVITPVRPDGFQGGTFNKTDTYQWAVGARWSGERLKASIDLARTDTTFTGSTASVDYATRGPYNLDINFDVPRGDGGPEFNVIGFDPANPANYQYRGFYEEAQQARSKDWQLRTDVTYDLNDRGLEQLQAGFRFTDRGAHREFGNRYFGNAPILDQNIPLSAVPLDYRLFTPGFGGSDIQPDLRSWLAPTYNSIRANLVRLRQFTIDRGGTGFTLTPVAPDPGQTYDASETTYAGYAQLRFNFEGPVRIDGVIGARYVRTQFAITGTTRNFDGSLSPVAIDRSYDDWLPNASARLRFNDKLQLRLSATRTRTRPTYAQYNPALTVGPPPTGTGFRTASGGNPNLDTVVSNNYDASLEYYFSPSGFASVAVFRRDLQGFLQPNTQLVQDPQFGTIQLNSTFNTGRGRIDGVEAQLTTFLDFLGLPRWAQGFGVQGNVTYIDAGVDYPGDAPGRVVRRPIIGVSDFAFNAAAFYERSGFATRLSYNYRGAYQSVFRPDPGRPYTERTEPISRLDFSASYDLNKALTIAFDAVNLLGDPVRVTETTAFTGASAVTYPRLVRYEETVYQAGIRFRF